MEREPIGRILGMTHRAHHILVDEKLQEIDADLHSGQFFLLHFLYKREGICQHELADYYRIDKAAVARGVQKLEEKGLVLKAKSPEDQRKTALWLTDKARGLQERFTRMLEEIDERIKSYLEEDEIDTFIHLIDKIYRGIAEEIEEIEGLSEESTSQQPSSAKNGEEEHDHANTRLR